MVHFERFFAFRRHEGVEPTNNVAERALRCAVQWRKISFVSLPYDDARYVQSLSRRGSPLIALLDKPALS